MKDIKAALSDYNGFGPIPASFGGKRLGRSPVPEVVLIFRGTHQVMSAEKQLKRAGVPMRLIPVPRRLSSDCGLAIRIFPPDRGAAKDVLSRSGILPKSVHVLRDTGEYQEEPL